MARLARIELAPAGLEDPRPHVHRQAYQRWSGVPESNWLAVTLATSSRTMRPRIVWLLHYESNVGLSLIRREH